MLRAQKGASQPGETGLTTDIGQFLGFATRPAFGATTLTLFLGQFCLPAGLTLGTTAAAFFRGQIRVTTRFAFSAAATAFLLVQFRLAARIAFGPAAAALFLGKLLVAARFAFRAAPCPFVGFCLGTLTRLPFRPAAGAFAGPDLGLAPGLGLDSALLTDAATACPLTGLGQFALVDHTLLLDQPVLVAITRHPCPEHLSVRRPEDRVGPIDVVLIDAAPVGVHGLARRK